MENEEPETHKANDHEPTCRVYIERVLDEEDLEDVTVDELADTIIRLGMSTGQRWAQHPSPDRVREELRRAHQISFIPDQSP